MSTGKDFEKDIKESVPAGVFFYRFRDGTSSWGGDQELTRFQAKNMCDCMLFDGAKCYFLELKSHKGKSLPFSAIRDNQLKELSAAAVYKNVVAGFLVNFSDLEKTYFCKVDDVMYFKAHEERKSIPVAWFVDWGKEIKGRKLKVHYRWNLKEWMDGI